MSEDVLGSRPLPTSARPALSPSSLQATSTVLRSSGEKEQSVYDATQLLGLVTRRTVQKAHAKQQAALRDRSSEPPKEDSQVLHGYVEPPFNLDNLTSLLFQSWEYFAICDQLAIDAVARGYDLVDAEEPGEPASAPERGEIDYAIESDEADKRLRKVVRDYLDHLCRDFFGAHITVSKWGQTMIWDYKATGNAYSEVLRGNLGAIIGYLHVPSRLILRHASGRAYTQIEGDGKEIAYFRGMGILEPRDKMPELYFTEEEASKLAGRGKMVLPGDLKPELLDWKIYHPNSLYYGIPPIVAALHHLVGNVYSQNRNLRFFINRGMPDYLIVVKAEASAFGDPEYGPLINQFVDSIEEHMKFLQEGEDYRVMTVRLPTGQVDITLEKLNTAIQDQEFAGYQKDNSAAIVRVYRMLPQRLGIIETAQLGSGSGETQEETYKRAQIDPLQELVEAALNAALDSAGFDAIRARFPEMDVLDEARELNMYVQASATGDISINEGRAWLSRIVKDQDFPEDPSEFAFIPKKLLEYEMAQLLAPGGTGVQTFAAGVNGGGLIRALLQPKPAPLSPAPPEGPADAAALRGEGRIEDRVREAQRRLMAPPSPGNGTREATTLVSRGA